MNKIIIPKVGKDGDSRDSSLIVYTITVAISIALFVLVMTIRKEDIYSVGLNVLSAIILFVSILFTFLAIEYLVDITSFGHNDLEKERGDKYKKVLMYYNWSIILIIISIIAITLNYTVRYLLDLINNDCKKDLNFFEFLNKCKLIIIILCFVIAFLVGFFVTKKWFKDIRYLKNAKFVDGKNSKCEQEHVS